MRKRESGHALVLVLLLMTAGALLITPSLRLSYTSLQTDRIVLEQTRSMYAIDAGNEYAMWNLIYNLPFLATVHAAGEGGITDVPPLNVCGIDVNVKIALQAVPGQGGIALAFNDAVIKPLKSVVPNTRPSPAYTDVYTYTLELEQMTDDLTPVLDAIYDVLPDGFEKGKITLVGGSQVSIDGTNWINVPDPAIEEPGGTRVRLKWPADYDPAGPTNTFSSDDQDPRYFAGIRNYTVAREKHYLRFSVMAKLPTPPQSNPSTQCNWFVLRPWGTVSGPQAPIATGTALPTDPCKNNGLLEVTKAPDPNILQPGEETYIKYTVTMENKQSTSELFVNKVSDYLPVGFHWWGSAEDSGGAAFASSSTEGTVSWDYDPETPAQSDVTIYADEDWGGQTRDRVVFEFQPNVKVDPGVPQTLVFFAVAAKEISGAYYNEVTLLPPLSASLPTGFGNPDITTIDKLYTAYSWEAGAVVVPSYDSTSSAGGMTINANLSVLGLLQMLIASYQVE